MRILLLAIIGVLCLAPTQALANSTIDEATGDVALAKAFWQSRGVEGCPDGISISVFYDPPGSPARGGWCRIEINAYWMPPNRWAPDREQRCTLMFHETRHALPDGTTGGVDGQGHTAEGLMAVPMAATPLECVGTPHPLKGLPRPPQAGVASKADRRSMRRLMRLRRAGLAAKR